MTHHCDKVELFVDGELPDREAEAFRLHLPDCVKCQLAMDRLTQLDFLVAGHIQQSAEQEAPAAARPPVRPRWSVFSGVAALFQPERRPFFMAAAALAAVLIVVVVRQPFQPSFQSDVWLARRQDRLLEARVSYPDADLHRPLAAKKMGSGEHSEELPPEDQTQLEKRDPKSVVAAFLVRGDPDLAGLALKKVLRLKAEEEELRLKEEERSPDLDSDHAVALMIRGKHEEALRVLDAALAKDSRHPQALWNRGLVLRELGLSLLAARDFSQVAALQEPGWSEEAQKKVTALQKAETERREQWDAVTSAGQKLLGGAEAGPLPVGFIRFPSARRHFYEAVRTAPSREAVLALLPLARELDALAGGEVLAGYVRRIAEADFARRAPLAASYMQLLHDRQLPNEEKERILTALLGSKEDDILLGALVVMDAASRHLAVFDAKAAASGDPWFQSLAAQERAKAAIKAGNWTQAIQTLLEARDRCEAGGLEYRCMLLDRELSSSYLSLHRFELARTQAGLGWKMSRARGERQMESSMLWLLSEVARVAGDTSLARAYLLEFLEHNPGDPERARRTHQALAVMEIHELQVDAARREIDAALNTGSPLGVPGLFALADISRMKRAPRDEEHLTQQLERLMPRLSPGDRLIATHVLGRFLIESDEARGSKVLRRVIKEAETPEFAGDSAARRARGYSFTSLLFAAGRRNDFQEALDLFEQEYQGELPRKCLMAATEDFERTLFLVKGEDGVLSGYFDEERRQTLPPQLDGVVPEPLLARLDTCKHVDVLARPPLHGRAGLLPSKLAWSYLTRTSAPRAQRTGRAIHLVVSDVELPPNVPLDRLNAWNASFGPDEQAVTLSGARATPSQVLASMKNATEIDLVAHGILNDYSDASYLLLAPEPGGPELGISKVRTASLQGAPFVVLAACRAAHTTFSADGPLSLPAAFIEAGARGVLAATVEIPDLEAEAFFNAVRERMRAGESPAQALRAERVYWLEEKKRGKEWLDSVLLFE